MDSFKTDWVFSGVNYSRALEALRSGVRHTRQIQLVSSAEKAPKQGVKRLNGRPPRTPDVIVAMHAP